MLQYGSYFGASLCAVDVNNDGLDDLLVGAPLYTHRLGDEGAVSLFLNLANVTPPRISLTAISLLHLYCLQCFDAVGWAARRASGL